MGSDKDRFGDKLREAERGQEDHYFAEQDRKLLNKMREGKEAAEEAVKRESGLGRCPRCGTTLVERKVRNLTVDDCPSCKGMWLDRGEFEELAKQEKGWLAKLLGLPD